MPSGADDFVSKSRTIRSAASTWLVVFTRAAVRLSHSSIGQRARRLGRKEMQREVRMQYEFSIQRLKEALRAPVLVAALLLPPPAHAADAAFTQFIASLWPEAQAAGVSRATFDTQ